MDNEQDKTLVSMAIEQKPEDFKEAVVGALNDRLRTAIADARESMAESLKGKEVVNKDDKTDKKPEVSTSKTEEPKATNPGAKGHVQKHEKKTGDKKAVEPKTHG